MASLLVFAKPDNLHPDPREQWQRFAPGDVIDIADNDAMNWGADIVRLGWWRVIVAPGVPAAALQNLLASEVPNPPTYRGIRRLRLLRLRLDDLRDEATAEQIEAATVAVPPPQDYYVIG